MVDELDQKVNINYGRLLQNIKDEAKESAINIRHNLKTVLRKDLVARDEFKYELEQKANAGAYDTKISLKSDKCMLNFIITNFLDETDANGRYLDFLNEKLEKAIIVLVEL